jgi:ribosomal protein S1
LSREFIEQLCCDKVDAMVTNVDKASRKIGLSINARESSEEK